MANLLLANIPEANEIQALREKVAQLEHDLKDAKATSSSTKSRAMSEAIDVIARATDMDSGPNNIYSVALNSLTQVLGIERASILFFDPDRVMRFKAWLGISESYRRAVEGHTPWTPDTFNPEPIVIPDIKRDPSLTPYLLIFEGEDIRALGFIPLLYRGRVVGKFMLYSRVPYDFDREIGFALTLGKLIAFEIFRERAATEFKELTDRLTSLATSISDYLWSATIERDGTFSYNYYSPVVEKITGHPVEFFTAGTDQWLGTVYSEDRERVEAVQRRLAQRISNFEIAEYRIVLPDGKIRWVSNRIAATALKAGATRLDGVVSDITDKMFYLQSRERMLAQETHARKEAERAIQLRDDFLSIAAHELRTPLTPVRMNLQLIKHHIEKMEFDIPKVEFLKKAVQGTDQEFERFLKLVENLLDVSRISAGRLVLDRSEFDLGSLVRDVINRFDAELKKAKCETHVYPQGEVIGRWDQSRIEQVLVNLLSNAMKYGTGKPIEITVSSTGAWARIQVKDHGIGVPKVDQGRIFHRFERLAQIKHFGGFGLGLFIAQEIVEAHGGKILLESELGVGSKFTVELPLL